MLTPVWLSWQNSQKTVPMFGVACARERPHFGSVVTVGRASLPPGQVRFYAIC